METAKAVVVATPADLGLEMSILQAFRTALELANPSSYDAAKAIPLHSAMVKSFSSSESAWESPLPLLPAFVSFSEKRSATMSVILLPSVPANVFSSAMRLVKELASAISF